MTKCRFVKFVFQFAFCSICLAAIGVAQDPAPTTSSEHPVEAQPREQAKAIQCVPNSRSNVGVLVNDCRQLTTQVEIDLQKAPNGMEPAAEPRSIRVDNRANVRFLLTNLSPLDVCTRTANAPTPTQETPVAESFVNTIASVIGGSPLAGAPASAAAQANALPTGNGCNVANDDEYKHFQDTSNKLGDLASGLIGDPTNKPEPPKCDRNRLDQAELDCEIQAAGKYLSDFAWADYRGQTDFTVVGNNALNDVVNVYSNPLITIQAAGALQAMVDEMSAWAADLHKKYDYSVPSPDSGSAPPPPVPGVLMVSPTSLTFAPSTDTTPPQVKPQVLQLATAWQAGTFVATPASDSNWLLVSKASSGQPSANPLRDTTPNNGTYPLQVTIQPNGLSATTHIGSITITGTGVARGTTIVTVIYKAGQPSVKPTDCDRKALAQIDSTLAQAKAIMSVIGDNNKALGSAQGSLKTAYLALAKVADDFHRRKDSQKIVKEQIVTSLGKVPVLVQEFNLGADRKDTSTGYISCVSGVDGKTATTTNINYSLLYQDVPRWSSSLGVLASFQQKKVIGILDSNTPGANPPVDNQTFGVTDQARVQLIPMAYLNYRIGNYLERHYGRGKEDEYDWTAHLSGGFGVNPNSGTNQPEFFTGFAVGCNHFMIHPGIHWGRRESLGGGYTLGSAVPAGLTSVPLEWSYHPAFSIGFSVRIAPY